MLIDQSTLVCTDDACDNASHTEKKLIMLLIILSSPVDHYCLLQIEDMYTYMLPIGYSWNRFLVQNNNTMVTILS